MFAYNFFFATFIQSVDFCFADASEALLMHTQAETCSLKAPRNQELQWDFISIYVILECMTIFKGEETTQRKQSTKNEKDTQLTKIIVRIVVFAM